MPNGIGAVEWGVHLSTVDLDDPDVSSTARRRSLLSGGTAPPNEARWIVLGSVYVSWDGREVVGPVGTAQLYLDAEGTVHRRPLAEPIVHKGHSFHDFVVMDWLTGGDANFDRQLVPAFYADLVQVLQELLYAALLAISFTHVKNVDVVEVDPDPRLSRAFQKRHGRRLKVQYVLDIGVMKGYLERDGQASRYGLAKAMHVCRGHFKTYTSERPLFGSVTGTYWWPAMVRGSSSVGVIEKDYRVDTGEPAAIAREWHDDDEALALAVSESGRTPMRARPDGPQFDLAYTLADGSWAVVEVKSVTDANEADQLRRGIGQVIDYRHAVGHATGTKVHAVLVPEREPASRWLEVCAEADIVVAWPGAFDRLPISG